MTVPTRIMITWIFPSLLLAAPNSGLVDEFDLKTAFIHKMTHFIRWQNEDDWDKKQFVIEVYRQDKRLIRAMKAGFREKLIREREVIIREIDSLDESNNPQILVVGEVTQQDIKKLIREQAGSLIVSDIPGIAERGVHINFIKKKNKIVFEMNLTTLEASGIKASAKVKQIAKIVETKS